MDKRPNFKTFKAKALKNAKVKSEYEALRPEFERVDVQKSGYHREQNVQKSGYTPEKQLPKLGGGG